MYDLSNNKHVYYIILLLLYYYNNGVSGDTSTGSDTSIESGIT